MFASDARPDRPARPHGRLCVMASRALSDVHPSLEVARTYRKGRPRSQREIPRLDLAVALGGGVFDPTHTRSAARVVAWHCIACCISRSHPVLVGVGPMSIGIALEGCSRVWVSFRISTKSHHQGAARPGRDSADTAELCRKRAMFGPTLSKFGRLRAKLVDDAHSHRCID